MHSLTKTATLAAATALIAAQLTACSGTQNASSGQSHANYKAGSQSANHDTVVVYSSDGDSWTSLKSTSDAVGRKVTELDGSNLLGGSISRDGRAMVARDPSEAHMNPVLNADLKRIGGVVLGETPSWNSSGSLGAFNSPDESLGFVDQHGGYLTKNQPSAGTLKDVDSGVATPFDLSDLEFDGWITDSSMLVHGDESGLDYGPYVAQLDGTTLNLTSRSGVNPNEIFFNGHDGTYLDVAGDIGRWDVATGKQTTIGHVTPPPAHAYTAIGADWSPNGQWVAYQTAAGGPAICKVGGGVACYPIDVPSSTETASTTFVWSRNSDQLVVNTLYTGGSEPSTRIDVVDPANQGVRTLPYRCSNCWVVGYMSPDHPLAVTEQEAGE
jgi:hypothetical protein